MAIKRAVGVSALMALAVTVGYWIGYENGVTHGRKGTAQTQRLSAVNSLRQVGLSYRLHRNDMTLSTTYEVAAPKPQTQDR